MRKIIYLLVIFFACVPIHVTCQQTERAQDCMLQNRERSLFLAVLLVSGTVSTALIASIIDNLTKSMQNSGA
jgi:hypothetical protein